MTQNVNITSKGSTDLLKVKTVKSIASVERR